MGKPHEERRKEIVQATMDLAAEEGIKRVTTQAIADRVGIAQPTVFRHFKTRDAIFSAVIGWIAENLFKAISSGLNPDEQADEQLRKLIQRQLGFINKHRAIPKVLFSDFLHLESPKLKTSLQEVMNRYIKRVTQLLQQGKESGVFRKDLDTDQTARYIAALIQGLVLRWSVYEFNFSLEDEAESIWLFLQPVLKKH
ncbi:MAG: TetR/AcrR family transcriptional regulator [Gammaproteobacteria bacterium]|nr:TetR/AcrR family transcriptional regulator [Gammaproteobacteria bacterium]